MSYDLWFWRQDKACRHRPETIVRRICEGGRLVGLKRLDLDGIESRMKAEFPGFQENIYDCGGHYFTIDLYSPYAFQIVSTPPESEEVIEMLNKIIDIAGDFDCRLYDPQTGERYA